MRYKLTRANLALNFGFIMNYNIYLEISRQNFKTMSSLCWYLWVFLFGTRNSKMLFFNKKMEDSKMNLQTLKDLRSALPDYLRMDGQYDFQGNRVRPKNNVESITNLSNNNSIKAAPSARNKMLAMNLGRGATVPFLYFDEYAFMPYNYEIYNAAAPAFSRAATNARNNMAPYGMLITSTPGDLLTNEGKEAYDTKEMATRFNESWYDLNGQQLEEIRTCNPKSNFIYIKYTYREIGRTDEYFDEMSRILKSNWAAIRREVLLEWSESTDNSPFEKQDLDAVKKLVRKPIRQMWIGRPTYVFDIYKDGLFYKYPPIIGVDVSGGFSKDASAITIIDSQTTEVLATFNCNFISIQDLGRVIYELVKTKMPNAVINIERNGGFGASVLSYLLSKPDIKPNLYYEVKDRVFEERSNGLTMDKKTRKVKVYGSDNTKENRLKLMEILSNRMKYHKDKFVSETIYNELAQLEVKKNGRIEHADNGHDDQIFSYLWALYVYIEGKNIMENWHIIKSELKTDVEYELADMIITNDNYKDLGLELIPYTSDDDEDDATKVNEQIKAITTGFILRNDFEKKQEKESEEALNKLFQSNPLARKAYAKKYHVPEDELNNNGYVDLMGDINGYYSEGKKEKDPLQKAFDNITNLR